MKVYAYGEDALTLWAIKSKLPEILKQLNGGKDEAEEVVTDCKIFFRPSFGRGKNYGEFDFIILANDKLYLGESKWDRSLIKFEDKSKKKLKLDAPQNMRHKIFSWYVDKMKNIEDWSAFNEKDKADFNSAHPGKTIPGTDTVLAKNLMTVLGMILNSKIEKLKIKNVFLYFYNTEDVEKSPKKKPAKTLEILNGIKQQQQESHNSENEEFQIVTMDYSKVAKNNLIEIEI